MGDFSLLAAIALSKTAQAPLAKLTAALDASISQASTRSNQPATEQARRLPTNVRPEIEPRLTEFSRSAAPNSGSQLYAQRVAALSAGRLYTRLPIDSFQSRWVKATRQPTYPQWKQLLALEARAVAGGQGNNRLSVLIGDSLSQWFPSDRLPSDRLWLNQGISGDTTSGVLQRLASFERTRPQAIYVMAGINDLKHGVSNRQIIANLQQIMARLKQSHPTARIVVQSILPTRSLPISNQQIQQLNQQLAVIARQTGVTFLDLYTQFADSEGQIRPEFTTDGLHLNAYGYQVWRSVLQQDIQIAERPTIAARRV